MDASIESIVSSAVQVRQGGVAQAAQLLLLKKAMNIEASGALALLESLPALATHGAVGTRLDTFA